MAAAGINGLLIFCFSEECVEDAKSLKDQKGLNLLVVGSSLGDVHMYAYGVFPVGTLQEIGVHISGKV